MPKLTKAEKLKCCIGCYNHFYNGNNPLGVRECWSLADAVLVWKKEVHMNQVPPWKQAPEEFLSCYRRSQFVYVSAEAEY